MAQRRGRFCRRTAARLAVGGALLCTAILGTAARANEAPLRSLAVLPFEIKDTSGEAIAPEARAALLDAITHIVRAEIQSSALYDVVPGLRTDAAVQAADLGTYLRSCNGCDVEIARGLEADRVLVGWIFKMSRLVLALHVRITDVASTRVVYDRTFDFRGDTQAAWQHAGRYMVRALTASGHRAMPQTPTE